MGEVTAAIRTLLAQGLTSGEIIAVGYRPGTVYKVQRSARLASALAQDRPPRQVSDELEDPDGEIQVLAEQSDSPYEAASHAEAIDAEVDRLREEVRLLNREADARLAALEHQVSSLELRALDTETQNVALQEAVRWIREAVADAVILLAQQTSKPAHGLSWAVPLTRALARIRRRLVEIDPEAARSLFGDRVRVGPSTRLHRS